MAFNFNMYKTVNFGKISNAERRQTDRQTYAGYERRSATKAIRENEGEGKYVPIIALTADVIVGVKEKLLEAGMDDYIVKQIDFVVLSGVLKKYLTKEKVKG